MAIIIPSADINKQLCLFRKCPFHPIWLLYMEAHPPNPKQSTSLQIYSINSVLPTWPSTHSQPNWKDTEKNEVPDRKRKRKMPRKRITLSSIDKEDWWLQISLCVYWQRQRAGTGSACSSEKWSRVSRLPTSPKCVLEHQLSFPVLTSSVPTGL